jgi:hypothetical protein
VERRLAITYIVSASITFGVACVAVAVTGGGLFASAAPTPADGKQVEMVDDYIVVHSSTTVVAGDAAPVVDAAPVAPGASRSAMARPQSPAASASADASASQPDTGGTDAPMQTSVSTPAEAAPAPAATPAPSETPSPATPAPAAPQPPSTTIAAARPPVPDGCINPRFRNGAWKCDDD